MIGVIFGGPSPEHDVSILTGLQASLELSRSGEEVLPIYWSPSGSWFEVQAGLEAPDFVEGVPRGAKELALVVAPDGGFFRKRKQLPLDSILNCCHGGPGEDGTLQSVLGMAGLPFSGPSIVGAMLGIDKLGFGALVAAEGIAVLPRKLVSSSPDERTDEKPPSFGPPFIVKPRFGGSSIGISVAEDWETVLTLARTSHLLKDGSVVEPYVDGAVDLSIAVRSFPALEVSPIERPLSKQGEVYAYEQKYTRGEGMAGAPRELPAKLPTTVEGLIRDAAQNVASPLRVRGVARIDFLWSGDDVWMLEINTIPGSLSLYLWEGGGYARRDVLLTMLREAREVPGNLTSSYLPDGSILRSAGSIASKLG